MEKFKSKLTKEDIEYIKKIAKKYGREDNEPIELTNESIIQATNQIINEMKKNL